MGMLTYRALFDEVPDLNTILDKLYQVSEFGIITEPFKISDTYPYPISDITEADGYPHLSINIIPHAKYNTTDVCIKISLCRASIRHKKDNIHVSECFINSSAVCEYYLYMVLCVILIDMGGEDKDGRLLSETFVAIPTWAREKWQGEEWFKKVNKQPTLFNWVIEKIRSLWSSPRSR